MSIMAFLKLFPNDDACWQHLEKAFSIPLDAHTLRHSREAERCNVMSSRSATALASA
jgi:hypothetical protein